MHISPAVLGPPIFLPVYLKAVRAGFPSPADDHPRHDRTGDCATQTSYAARAGVEANRH